MNPFVHCIHYYKAIVQFFRNNMKKIYRMHFLFFCKAPPTIEQRIESNQFQWFLIFDNCYVYFVLNPQVHQPESDRRFKMGSVQMKQPKLQPRRQQHQQNVIRQRQSRLYCVSCFFRFYLFRFLTIFGLCDIIQFRSFVVSLYLGTACAHISLLHQMVYKIFPNCVHSR